MKIRTLILLLMLYLLLPACGLTGRSLRDLPPQLHSLYLDTPNPYSPLSIQFKRLLESVNVRIVSSPLEAPITFHILSTQWVYSDPTIVYSGYAATYTYTLIVNFSLTHSYGKIVLGPKSLSVTRSYTQNANQVYVPEAGPLMKQEITRTMANLLFDHLSLQETHQALKAVNYSNY